MPEIRQQHVDRLAKLVAQLAASIEEMRGENVEPPEPLRSEVAAKIAKRQCLVCGDIIPLNKRYTRGQCASCGQNSRNAIKRNETTERELIEYGAMAAEKKTGGRRLQRQVIPISELMMRLRSKDPKVLAADLADAQRKLKDAEQNTEQKKERRAKKPQK